MIYVGNFIYHGASNTKETLTNVILRKNTSMLKNVNLKEQLWLFFKVFFYLKIC
jgi:hypothetical protein